MNCRAEKGATLTNGRAKKFWSVVMASTLATVAMLAAGTTAGAAERPTGTAQAAAAVAPGRYVLTATGRQGPTTQFEIRFGGAYTLTADGGGLQLHDSSGRVVEEVPPTVVTASGHAVNGIFSVQGTNRFSFTRLDSATGGQPIGARGGIRPRFSWGSFWCGTAATISGAVGGAFLGGPIGAGFGLGTGIAAAATC